MKYRIICLILPIISAFSYGQEHLSGFLMNNVIYKVNNQWAANIEFQQRGNNDYFNINYYEIKGGVGYNFASDHQGYIGLGKYVTYRDGHKFRDEFRVWEQWISNFYIDRIKMENRIRVEQRFFYNPVNKEYSYDNRFRYRLNTVIPINKKKLEEKTLFFNAFDELFLGLNRPVIMRNRIYLGGGYQFSRSFTLSLGYLLQRDFSVNTNSNLHYLYTAFSFTINQKKKYRPSNISDYD